MRKRILSSGWMFVKSDSILNILVCWPVFKRGQVARTWASTTHQSVKLASRRTRLESGAWKCDAKKERYFTPMIDERD